MPDPIFNNDPIHQAGVDQGSKLGESEVIFPDKPVQVRFDTARLPVKEDILNAIFGGSRDNIGVIGQSIKSIGMWGEGLTGVIGVSNTPTGDGVFGEGRRGVVGNSKDFQGVYGHSTTNAGVVGESDTFDGIWGVSHNSTKAGVFGVNKNGFGVTGHSDSNTGVSGDSNTGIGVHGKGGSLAGFFEGDVEITGDIRLSNADCAEDFDIAQNESAEPGTVMILGEEGALYTSHLPYDKRVAGVISGAGDYKPGIVLDKQKSLRNRQPIALLGKVYCKVDAQYGAVEIGDLLTTSATLGHAMKAGEMLKAFGTIIGKALRPLKNGKGLIPILITLQ